MEEAETKPLTSLVELLTWTDFTVDKQLVGLPLNIDLFDGSGDTLRPQTLVCHDMKGGYLEDRFANGTVVDSDGRAEPKTPFYFCHWWHVDIFVYFSHHLVTIPPKGWIDAGHKHGVTVLGTLITEWKDCANLCKEMLRDKATVLSCVEKLVGIAKGYRFDGWLINIENEIEIDQLANLRLFLESLTLLCKKELGSHSQVIWYDSVIGTSGRLKWQDELNALNKPFFDVCDGIFLNYGWTEASLRASVNSASADCNEAGTKLEHLCKRIFVGVDCFGRGCLGGGGFNCIEAVNLIRKYNLSVALFGPGWTHETLPEGEDFTENNQKFWSLLNTGLYTRVVSVLPFRTTYDTHLLSNYQSDPANIFADQCITKYNMSQQGLQPFFNSQPKAHRGGDVRLDTFDKRTCYLVRFTQSYRLICCRLGIVAENRLTVSVTLGLPQDINRKTADALRIALWKTANDTEVMWTIEETEHKLDADKTNILTLQAAISGCHSMNEHISGIGVSSTKNKLEFSLYLLGIDVHTQQLS